ncbi:MULTISPECIES: ParB/RepB/Spo0J family partition protein [Agrobacterium]|uniref:ParB/RepB/Spo0J family partition protein n=2 Tax=Agrobacterium salinitolerans TaxID=1183413 RepID=A0A9X3KTA1_9HYPH|nr:MULTISPECIES: ParB/RepB/Spo0J family partition protein [Agrobacterium]MCZ7854925.1 ParB/RepB/Spo0J family partition protein [Agrobacterium salinitolerans]MCZ7859607.1 ParB/RepB/Spo0J family partition protein [Agrobacterium salinitolerans]MCZ7889739.1 ParB/RepB/Spo0J family partition protein [Agrobacterium salinitolerans]MCZ7894655.1 ParB/RepB/Spo0J family partition protein [Agrobacterium salinitolerans]MCZ7940530.1 ParB/RepB/Spo0J family partition protein [Agrobacterium salinitolerans]
MNVITMPETAETIAIEVAAAAPVTSLMHDTQQIPLSKLVASSKNVRKRNAAMTIPELAASIEAHGLIQNLTIRKTARGNKYEVVAGSRRFAALLHLVAQGKIDKSAVIPCNLRSGEANDTEVSLAENTQREAMHIVDEIMAYRQLIEEGMIADTIAARFGQSVVTVRQRLKLANLSPKILGVLREDGMHLDQARALAISDDHAAQDRAWFDTQSWNRDPHSLRAVLTRDHVRSTDKLALFVGTEAYEAAGGTIARDLFAEADNTFLTDRALLTKLAKEALEQKAEPLKIKGWKWVDTSLGTSAIHNGGFARIFPISHVSTEAEQTELASLAEQFDEIACRIEDYAESDSAIDADEAELARIEQRIEDIKSAGKVYDTEEKALAGCIVTIAHDGTMHIEQGLVQPDDLAALRALRNPDTANGDAGQDDESVSAGTIPAVFTGAKHGGDEADEQPMAYSAALIKELTAIRTAAMRNELTQRPELALAVMLYPLVLKTFLIGNGYWRIGSAIEIGGQLKDLAPSIKETDACDALNEWTRIHETWGYKLPGNPGDLWEWLLEQPLHDLLELLAVVTAANINAVEAKHDHDRERLTHADQLAAALKLDMHQHWKPKAPFLSRLSKAQIAEVMEDAGCAKSAIKAAGKAPKAEAVELAEKALAGKTWLPGPLRSPIEDAQEGEEAAPLTSADE